MLAQTKLPHWITIFLLSLAIGSSSSPAQEIKSVSREKVITVDSTSGSAEIALAQHLRRTKAKLYGAYWCSHCYKQIYLFGQQAFNFINRIECDPQGKNSQSDLCKTAKIQAYPTWEINGKFYPGVQSLNDLAALSGYEGTSNFKNSIPVNIPSQYSPRRGRYSVPSSNVLNRFLEDRAKNQIEKNSNIELTNY